MKRFVASECVLGAAGLLLVGAREPGTRVIRRTINGDFELAFPFEPTRNRPVAWMSDGAFRVVGRNGEDLVVDAAGKTRRGRIERAGVLAGVGDTFAVGVGPKFFEERAGQWHDVTPRAPGHEKLSISARIKAAIGATKIVRAIANGPAPAAFVDGAVWQRIDGTWRERTFDGRIITATATAGGTIYAATATKLHRITPTAITEMHVELGEAQIQALAVSSGGLLIGTERGLLLWRQNELGVVDLPGAGGVTDVAAFDDIEVCIRDGTAWTRRFGGDAFEPWEDALAPRK